MNTHDVSLRPATAADREFVEGLFFETQRWLIERLFGWRGEKVERAKFDDFYDDRNTQIIELHGHDVGWITVLREPGHIEIDSIYIAPPQQGAGLGTYLLNAVIAEADAADKPVTISTAKINPARKLYERLGFTVIGESEFKIAMRREPSHTERSRRL